MATPSSLLLSHTDAAKSRPKLTLSIEAEADELEVLCEQRWKLSSRRTNVVRLQALVEDLEEGGCADKFVETLKRILTHAGEAYDYVRSKIQEEELVQLYEAANPEKTLVILAQEDAERIDQDIAVAADGRHWINFFRTDMDFTLSQWKPLIAGTETKQARERRRKNEGYRRQVDRQFRESVGVFLNHSRWEAPDDEVPAEIMQAMRRRELRLSGADAKVRMHRALAMREPMEPTSDDEAHSPQSLDGILTQDWKRERPKSIERAIADSGLTLHSRAEREQKRERAIERAEKSKSKQGELQRYSQREPKRQSRQDHERHPKPEAPHEQKRHSKQAAQDEREQQREHPHPLRQHPPSQTSLPQALSRQSGQQQRPGRQQPSEKRPRKGDSRGVPY